VSTGQTDKGGAAGSLVFETRDFYLACFLRCTGYDLIDMRAEGRRKVFVFRDRPTRRDAPYRCYQFLRPSVLAFYADTISVRPSAFVSTIKDMKGLLHNG
jgi:Domain of unknown function (DUF5659)